MSLSPAQSARPHTLSSTRRLLNALKPPIKLHWWRLENTKNGNFGDEVTKAIIKKIYNRRVIWTPANLCEINGAGSTIEEVTQNKGSNRPYLWGSGFIQPGELTISSNDYKIIGVRGKESLKRVIDPAADILLGDIGILASCLVSKMPKKQYTLGILSHYIDKGNPAIEQLARENDSILLIDSLWTAEKIAYEIAKCDAVLSSSLHGLIFADSLGVPNLHLKLSDNLKGGEYKFKDYYSIYTNDRYHEPVTPQFFEGKTQNQIKESIFAMHKPIPNDELTSIKKRLIDSFPFI